MWSTFSRTPGRPAIWHDQVQGPSGNKVYILLLAPRPAGKARATSIPGAVCKERATPPAGLRAAARRGAAAGGALPFFPPPPRDTRPAPLAAPPLPPPPPPPQKNTPFSYRRPGFSPP